ncbi:hypothetical protein Dimus_036734, partial [Dionaea muscipula]
GKPYGCSRAGHYDRSGCLTVVAGRLRLGRCATTVEELYGCSRAGRYGRSGCPTVVTG